ncbi:MAG TPA: aromatic ring-hydroxylating dioxygenase subunit alpha [Xanthobacteraceae bacterium]|nr:aromatic ring-hydroxylating dioxygenase subunit alpha [Xanthobacteraceae bacterium]
MNEALPPNRQFAAAQFAAANADPDEFLSLPGWLYHDAEFFAHEAERVFRPSWQVVCHVNDIPQPGDYHTFDFLNEAIVVIRGDDGVVRAFHNVCRHRASRLVDGPSGHCNVRLTCRYHAWSYDLRGNLAGIPFRDTFVGLDPAEHGLKPVAHEIYHGFIFVRLAGAGPSVAEMMAPYESEIAPYRMEELVPLGRVTLRPRMVNWKNIADNYSDSLHINVAHPGLTRLFGRGYGIEAREWVDKMWGYLRDQPSTNRSERMYQQILPQVPHLPEDRQRLWIYFKLWPNVAFDIYPDQVDFMQFLPLTATTTMIREIAYVHPDARREMKAARYLNWRINRQVNKEDTALIASVQQGMTSSSYDVGPLGSTEVCLRSFARKYRALMPVVRNRQAPPPGWSQRSPA